MRRTHTRVALPSVPALVLHAPGLNQCQPPLASFTAVNCMGISFLALYSGLSIPNQFLHLLKVTRTLSSASSVVV